MVEYVFLLTRYNRDNTENIVTAQDDFNLYKEARDRKTVFPDTKMGFCILQTCFQPFGKKYFSPLKLIPFRISMNYLCIFKNKVALYVK